LTVVLLNYAARTAFVGLILMLSLCSDQFAAPIMKVENDDRARGISPATQNFNEWLDSEYATQLDFYPLIKTIQGVKSDYGDLDDVSEQALDRQLAWRGDGVARIQSEFDRLSSVPKGNYPEIYSDTIWRSPSSICRFEGTLIYWAAMGRSRAHQI